MKLKTLQFSADDALTAMLTELVQDAQRGDADAARELHRQLAFCLARRELPEVAREALILMHTGIAAGLNAGDAMLTTNPSHRKPERFRDETIALEVIADKLAEPKTSLAELFRRAAKRHSVPVDSVRKGYYRHKNIIFPRQG